jgi:N-acetylmuramoyl-L-alanine amidase
VGYKEHLPLILLANGNTNNSAVLSLDIKNSEDKIEENSKADSKQLGADAINKADSSSATQEKLQDTEEIAEVATKETTDAEQETEKSATKNTEQNVIDLSSKDIKILQRIVEAEATGENIKGKILVANVILNRVNDNNFPNNLEGVVFQRDGNTYQFSPIKDDRYWSVDITRDTIKAVERVMQGEDYSKGALYFSARSKADKNSMRWFDNNLDYLFEYGGHEFFK